MKQIVIAFLVSIGVGFFGMHQKPVHRKPVIMSADTSPMPACRMEITNCKNQE